MYLVARAYMVSIFEHHFDNVKGLTGVKHSDFLSPWIPSKSFVIKSALRLRLDSKELNRR